MNSLFFTGPVTIRKGISKLGKSPEEAMTTATVRTLGAGKRLALQGGRDVIMDAVQRDPAVKGVARVTDGDPCYFCAMLASRGAIYRSEETAAFDAHDDCGCEPEPVYSRSDYMTPGRSQEFADLYGQIPGGLSPADSRRAFRGLYERGAVPDKFLG